MSIRAKIILAFVFLAAAIAFVVSFWAANTIGFQIDSSDMGRLGNIKNAFLDSAFNQKLELDRINRQISDTFAKLDILSFPDDIRKTIFSEILDSLELDCIAITDRKNTLFSSCEFIFSEPPSDFSYPLLVRFSGKEDSNYVLISSLPFKKNENLNLLVFQKFRAELPGENNLYFLLKNGKTRYASDFLSIGNQEFLSSIDFDERTKQVVLNDFIFRLRSYALEKDFTLLSGYMAQKAIISSENIYQLLFRLALLQVVTLIVFGYFLGSSLLAPLKLLNDTIARTSDYEFEKIPLDKPPMINSGYEIENTAKAFNEMADRLTEAKKTLLEMERKRSSEEKLVAIGRFSGSIAHEINNPLGIILLYAQTLRKDLREGKELDDEDLKTIEEEVKRCKNIIDVLRVYTKKSTPALTVYTAQDFISKMKELILKDLPPELLCNFSLKGKFDNITLKADFTALAQVSKNLVENAVYACLERKEPKVFVLFELEGDFLRFSFSDNGKGFQGEPDKLFEPLYTTRESGTGLGLLVIQSIVEGHGGKISASREEELTTFELLFPINMYSDTPSPKQQEENHT
ncbi:MAG: HAMP domain-containing histidine kinase [Candidatus Riflebacteria bacterium]|nr:HAMP domain-containing histidine kinase [Candidatus Riflebacteria bacterium]